MEDLRHNKIDDLDRRCSTDTTILLKALSLFLPSDRQPELLLLIKFLEMRQLMQWLRKPRERCNPMSPDDYEQVFAAIRPSLTEPTAQKIEQLINMVSMFRMYRQMKDLMEVLGPISADNIFQSFSNAAGNDLNASSNTTDNNPSASSDTIENDLSSFSNTADNNTSASSDAIENDLSMFSDPIDNDLSTFTDAANKNPHTSSDMRDKVPNASADTTGSRAQNDSGSGNTLRSGGGNTEMIKMLKSMVPPEKQAMVEMLMQMNSF